MTLREKQSIFAYNVAVWIVWVYNHGYEITFGDAFRDPRCPYGHVNSLHKSRLALDFNLFKDGKYLIKSEDYKEVGEHWKTLHDMNMWGGDFDNPDGNHISMAHSGMR